MRRLGHRGKVDANQGDIVRALERVGAKVQSLAGVGDGVPDLLVLRHGKLYLLEVKGPKTPLTPAESEWHAKWERAGGVVAIVRTPKEALEAIGVRTI